MDFKQVLIVAAFILAFIAAIPYQPSSPNPSWPWRLHLIAAALACYFGSLLFH
jgi:hypothetical protein